jgi:hypothetical protein
LISLDDEEKKRTKMLEAIETMKRSAREGARPKVESNADFAQDEINGAKGTAKSRASSRLGGFPRFFVISGQLR